MFLFLPVGVEGATLRRVPYVSIGIALVCALAFTASWVLPDDPDDVAGAEREALIEYWMAHPYLEVAPDFARQHLSPNTSGMIASLGAAVEAPTERVRALEQAELDQLARVTAQAAEANLLWRWSLVRQRGVAQAGWLTHLFLHLGWMHLLGNMLFFYLVGPLLEEAWGKPLFLAFYLLGGLGAAAAQVAFDSSGMLLGASGAIAACIGAFVLRYARSKVRIGYLVILLFRFWHGTFLVPAWLWGLFWFASELYDLRVEGGTSGVAVMAHLGGFAFGFATAAGLRLVGIGEPPPDPRQAALDAQAHHEEALERDPVDIDALAAVSRAEFDAGRREAGMARAERAVRLLLNKKDEPRLFRLLSDLSGHFDPHAIHPILASGLAAALDRAPAGLQPLREPALRRAGDAATEAGAQALLRLAQLQLQRGDDLGARELLEKARAIPGLERERVAAIDALLARAGGAAAPTSPSPSPARRVVECALLGVTTDALALDFDGRQVTLPIAQLQSIRAALVAQEPIPVLVTDLLLAAQEGAPATVVRIEARNMSLAALFPGAAPQESYPRLIAHLARRSGASTVPSLEAIARGAFPQVPSREDLGAMPTLEAAVVEPWQA